MRGRLQEANLKRWEGDTYAGWVSRSCELRNSENQGADGVTLSGRQHGGARKRECATGPAESKTPGMHGNFTHENREAPLSSAGRQGGGTVGEGDEL